MRHKEYEKGIPVSMSLNMDGEQYPLEKSSNDPKKRIVFICALAILIAVGISFVAKLLVSLINLTTQLFFFQNWSFNAISPAMNTMGWLVIFIPAVGGIIVGIMAVYGSKAIRGHGIPEAMEQVLTNHSKINPAITYLKPLSAAIAIGAGGPFGAEGPIIATGGAFGSTLGQLLRISANERKILLAAGATAGMSAIFGSPVAAIFLAIELLLFEFSARAIIPVALACITGAAGHHYLFEAGPVFAMKKTIEAPTNTALLWYSVFGIMIGVLAVGVTKMVYFIEDLFEKLPIHWMWWPSIGGLVVGVVGYVAPHTLGVGYENITNVLNAAVSLRVILSLCILKFISWSIALGSGTSGGTLAPLLTIGAATGALLAILTNYLFPMSGVTVELAALVGMSAMFSGASRAFLTSILFALETTGQFNGLLPLLAACTAAYFISFFLMENTIMTEKISRRGITTPAHYEPDILQSYTVKQVMDDDALVVGADQTVADLKNMIKHAGQYYDKDIVVMGDQNHFEGLVAISAIVTGRYDDQTPILTVTDRQLASIGPDDTLKKAVEKMIGADCDVLAVLTPDHKLSGVLGYRDLMSAYELHMQKEQKNGAAISLRRRRLKFLVKRNRLLKSLKNISSS